MRALTVLTISVWVLPGAVSPAKRCAALARSQSLSGGVRYLGRVRPSDRELTWSGTGIAFSFEGPYANVSFSHVTKTSYISLSIDEGAPRRIAVSPSTGTSASAVVNISAKAEGSSDTPDHSGVRHHVTIRKHNEAAEGTLTVEGVHPAGRLVNLTATPGTEGARARRIEFVGDSFTAALGILKKEPCGDIAANEDVLLSYCAITAEALKADYSILAWSGAGLLRNLVNSDGTGSELPTMPHRWTRYSPLDAKDGTYPFPREEAPHAVVIALGTNDFAYDSSGNGKPSAKRPQLDMAAFTAAYSKFITAIRAKYPSCHVFICNSPMLSDYWPSDEKQHTSLLDALHTVAKGSSDVAVVDFPTQNTSDTGCFYHPSIAEHRALAQILTPVIKKGLSW